MKVFILDTNILLDLFVFHDPKVQDLKQAIVDEQLQVISSQKTIAELEDVIARPLFALESDTQRKIMTQWQSLSIFHDDSNLTHAPWACEDKDDQVFLDLAYQCKPAVIVSKDNALLKLASRTIKENILITAEFNPITALTYSVNL